MASIVAPGETASAHRHLATMLRLDTELRAQLRVMLGRHVTAAVRFGFGDLWCDDRRGTAHLRRVEADAAGEGART